MLQTDVVDVQGLNLVVERLLLVVKVIVGFKSPSFLHSLIPNRTDGILGILLIDPCDQLIELGSHTRDTVDDTQTSYTHVLQITSCIQRF